MSHGRMAATCAAFGAAMGLATLLIGSVAAAASGVRTWPLPPPGSYAQLHQLPSFGCDTQMGTLPDGTRGFFLAIRNRDGATTTRFHHLGNGTCASRVENSRELRRLTLKASGEEAVSGPVGPLEPDRFVLKNESIFRSEWMQHAQTIPCRSTGKYSFTRPVAAEADDPACGGPMSWLLCKPEGQIVHEVDVASVLTLQRNSERIEVARRVGGAYDVLAITRRTLGMCTTSDCTDFSAVSTLGHPHVGHLPLLGIPLVTRQTPSGSPMVVKMFEEDVLTLGRGVLVNDSWLGNSGPWQFDTSVTSFFQSSFDRTSDRQSRRARSSKRSPVLGDFLERLAHVLCAPPQGSFVRDPSLCKGIHHDDIAKKEAEWLTGLMFEPGGLADADDDGPGERVASVRGTAPATMIASWTFAPRTTYNLSQPLPCTATGSRDYNPRPEWQWGLGPRELSVESTDEVALAQSLSTCLHPAEENHTRLTQLSEADRKARMKLMDRLSVEYDRSLFADATPPNDPVENADLVQALVVVLPEFVALAVMVATTHHWERGAVAAAVVVLLAGAISHAAIIFLALQEHAADAWRGAGLREALYIGLPSLEGSVDLRNGSLMLSETLFVVARSGYRPQLLCRLAIGAPIVFFISSSLLVLVAVFLARRRRQATSIGSSRRLALLGAPSASLRLSAMSRSVVAVRRRRRCLLNALRALSAGGAAPHAP